MLTRRYPPYNVVESTRPAMFAKYLPNFGWQPLVVCGDDRPEDSGDRYDPGLIPESLPHVVCRVPPEELKPPDEIAAAAARALGRLCRLEAAAWRSLPADVIALATGDGRAAALWALDNLLPERNPYPFTRNLLDRLGGLIRRYRPEVIWATAPPPGPHTAAAWAARRFGIPWVADFRDVLEQSSVWAGRRTEPQRRWGRARETRVARTAAAAAMVSPALAAALSRRLRRDVAVIPNGFDEAAGGETPPLSEKFTIAYTGSVYIPQQDPGLLFAALDRLLAEGTIDAEHLSVDFYGHNAAAARAIAAGFNCGPCVHDRGTVSRTQCLNVQRSSQVLLLLAVGAERGILTGKVFEYLGARRPILCVPGDRDCVDALLAETGAGTPCSTPEQVQRTLLDWHAQWKVSGAVRFEGRLAAIGRYSRRRQAEQLAGVLDRVTGQRG